MRMILMAFLAFGLLAMAKSSPAADKPLATVASVNLERYMGKWYEIAAFPQSFEKGCNCTMAEYSMTEKGYVRVLNTCRKESPDGKPKTAEGKAFVVKGSNNAKLRVQFFWPFRGDYWIIDLADDYSYAVVGAPGRNYLWILSRTSEMDPVLYQQIVDRTAAKGFDVSKLRKTDQTCAGK